MRNVELAYTWWARLDLNQEPTDYESAALTVELRARTFGRSNCAYHIRRGLSPRNRVGHYVRRESAATRQEKCHCWGARDAVKVALTAPPVDGRANQACVDFFADLLKLQRSAITIFSGESSRNKVIRVAGISAEALREKLQL